jgi:hypothetical protein
MRALAHDESTPVLVPADGKEGGSMQEILRNSGLVLLTSIATVTCQIMAKYGLRKMPTIDLVGQPVQTLLGFFTSPFIVGGLLIQVMGFSIWLTVISKTNLTWAIGVATVWVYLLTAIANKFLLGEGLSQVQATGLALMGVGAILLSYSPGQ